jgi:tRNA threonylcarbamoyladenosine biosynthesis protein TsaE
VQAGVAARESQRLRSVTEPPEIRAQLAEPALQAWGQRIGRESEVPLVLALYGELGVGKSTLARAVARGAGVEGSVPSPTFNLLFVYETPRARVYHLDLYRLERAADVWELGWADLGSGPDLVLIEWADRAAELLPPTRWDIYLSETANTAERRVEARAIGQPPRLPAPSGSG